MELSDLRHALNRPVRLYFRDGEIVDAILLGASPTRDRDITYEVREILKEATPPARGSRPGSTCIAPIEDVAKWEPLPGGQAAV